MLKKIVRIMIRIVPQSMGFSLMRTLASKVARVAPRDNESIALQLAWHRMIGQKNPVKLWIWGNGPVVLLVHGWGGRASQMAPLAAEIAAAGFQAIAFDLSGHGESLEPVARWDHFFRDLGEVSAAVGPLFAFVGHSAGGLALMASRQLQSVKAKRHICVCAPAYPHPPVLAVEKQLNPGAALLGMYRDFLAKQFHATWQALENGQAFAGAGRDTLLIYDHSDRYIPHTEGDLIQTWCPDTQLIKTEGLGHLRILSSPNLSQLVTDFLKKEI